jgi:beta-glucosidase
VSDDRPWLDPTKSPEERASRLVEAMTFEEKADTLTMSGEGWDQSGYVGGFKGVSRLGLPAEIRYNDGP